MVRHRVVLSRAVGAGLVLGVFGPILPATGAGPAATEAETRAALALEPSPPTDLPYDEQALLQRLSQAEGMLRVGRPDVAEEMARQLPTRGPHAATTLRVRGWALLQLGSYQVLADLLADWSHPTGELLFLRGAGRRRAGDRVGGLDDLQRLWWQQPQTVWGLAALRELAEDATLFGKRDRKAITVVLPAADSGAARGEERAAELLDRLSRRIGRKGRLAAEVHRAIGLRLIGDEEFSQAAAVLEKALRESSAAELRRAILLALGEAERRRGNTRLATRHFDAVIAEDDSTARDHLSLQALAAAGQMFIEYRRYPEARSRFREQLLLNPVGPARRNALWGLGWIAFRTGDFPAARRFFQTLLAEAPFGPRSAGAAYWSARALEEMGARDQAHRELAAVEVRYPVSYYAYRAEDRLTRAGGDPLGDAAPPTPALLPHGPDSRVARIAKLVDAGMHERARRSLNALARDGRATLGPVDLDRSAELARELGATRAAERFTAQRANRFPVIGARSADPRQDRLFPATYTRLARRASRRARVDADLAIALTRQESGFNPRAVSPAGAVGLMQLLPATARALLREERREVQADTETLMEPSLNLRLGTRYLGRMLRAFGGREEYALAAYNAGPGAVTRWRQARGDLPEEIFVEEIPYRETREYVRRVLGSLRAWQLVDAARRRPAELASARAE